MSNPNPETDEVSVTILSDEPGNKQYQLQSGTKIAWFPKSEVTFTKRNIKTGVATAEIPTWLLKDREWLAKQS